MRSQVLSIFVVLFLAYAKCSDPPTAIPEITELPEETKEPVTEHPMPDKCTKIARELTCNGRSCWVDSSVYDCVQYTVVGVNLTMSAPAEDPKCDPAQRICVAITDLTYAEIYGFINIVPQRVMIIDNEGVIVTDLTIGPKAPSTDIPVLPTDIPWDEPSKYPDDCKTTIRHMVCEQTYCWAVAKPGDCVDMTITTSDPIHDTEPLYDPHCNLDKRLCTYLREKNTTMIVQGTLSRVPYSAYQMNHLGLPTFSWNFVSTPPVFTTTTTSAPGATDVTDDSNVEATQVPPLQYPERCTSIQKELTCNGIPCWLKSDAGDCVDITVRTDDIRFTIPEPSDDCNPALTLCTYNFNGETVRILGYLEHAPQQAVLVSNADYVRMLVHFQPTAPPTNKPDVPEVKVYPVSKLPSPIQGRIRAFFTGTENTPEENEPDNGDGSGGGNSNEVKTSTTSSSSSLFVSLGLVFPSVILRMFF